MDELPKEVNEFFDSRGEKAPEAPPAETAKEPQPPEAETKAEVKEEAKVEETKAETKTAPDKKDPPDERDNLKKALDEERTRRKEIAAQLKAESDRRAELEKKFTDFMAKLDEEKKPKPPAYEENPADHLRARLEAEEERRKALEEKVGTFEKQSAEEKQMTQFQNAVARATVQFMQGGADDYPKAYEHIRNVRKAELLTLGVDPAQADDEVNKWELHIAGLALHNGKNPAEVIYRQAEALGYKKAAPTNGATNNAKAETNKETGEEKIARLAKGQDAAASLGTGKADEPFSLEKLAEMNDDDLASFVTSGSWGKLARML